MRGLRLSLSHTLLSLPLSHKHTHTHTHTHRRSFYIQTFFPSTLLLPSHFFVVVEWLSFRPLVSFVRLAKTKTKFFYGSNEKLSLQFSLKTRRRRQAVAFSLENKCFPVFKELKKNKEDEIS